MADMIVSNEDIKNFLKLPSMNNQEGIAFAYLTDQATLEELIPEPLKLVAPIVAGYVVHMGNPSFGDPYLEESLFAFVSYKDKMVGAYPISLLLHGPGAENGVLAGREGAGIPKKLADSIDLRRSDKTASAVVMRHGKKLLDVTWTAGEVNEPAMLAKVGGQFKPGVEAEMNSFFYKYVINQHSDGTNHFSDVHLLDTQLKSLIDSVEMGSLSIDLESSEDDPFGELKVLKPLGAGWFHMKTSTMFNTLDLAEVDADKTIPKLLSARYDRGFFNPKATSYKI